MYDTLSNIRIIYSHSDEDTCDMHRKVWNKPHLVAI